MVDDIRRRTACDRCHSQKLKCPKRSGADICERCLKAKTSCSYSPFRQKKIEDQHSKDHARKNVKKLHTDNTPSNTLFEAVIETDQSVALMSDEGMLKRTQDMESLLRFHRFHCQFEFISTMSNECYSC